SLVLVDETNQHLGNNAATDGAKTETAGADGSLAQNVEPQWGFGAPSCRGDANLLCGGWRNSETAGHRLSGREPDALAALQITHSKGVIIVDLALARDCNRQLDK